MLTLNSRAQLALDGILAAVNDPGAAAYGLVRLYDGSQPANVSDPATGTLLANVGLVASGAAAFAPSTGDPPLAVGTVVSGAFAGVVGAIASGTATYWRLRTHAGVDIAQGSITTAGGGGELELSTTTILPTSTIIITSFEVRLTGIS